MSIDPIKFSEIKSPTAPPVAMYEYLQVQATVINFTSTPMLITGSDLSWGKWMQSPVDVEPQGSIAFGSQGREDSPSGTTGWAAWKIGTATITVKFDCPLRGSNSQSITCDSASFVVSATGTGGDVNRVTFVIKPA